MSNDNTSLADEVLLAWEAYQAVCIQAAGNAHLTTNPCHAALREAAYDRFQRLFKKWVAA